MREFTLLGFIAHLHALEHDMHALGPKIIEAACQMVAAEAKRVLGKGYDDWPALRPETIARKLTGDSPLLETGELRDSIEWTSSGNEGWVGSNNDKAVWHELGTSRIPPRSFLVGAAQAMEDKIHKMAGRAVVAVLMGRGLASAEMRELFELLHLIKDTAHEAAENLKPLVAGEEQESRERRR